MNTRDNLCYPDKNSKDACARVAADIKEGERAKAARDSAQQFFLEHAGYSYKPGEETPEQGRERCAQALAWAEAEGREAGLSFTWEQDRLDSSEWSNEEPAWAQYVCVCRDEDGKVVTSLGGVDFGRDGAPWSDPYRRVVEAELAQETLLSL